MKASATRNAAPAGRSAAAPKTVARFRMRISRDEAILVGPGKISLLEAIAKTRSITAAAKSIGMSYRRAWILVDQVNAALRQPAVASSIGGEHGGGSRLTEAGLELVSIYRRIEATAAQASAADLKRLLRLLA